MTACLLTCLHDSLAYILEFVPTKRIVRRLHTRATDWFGLLS
jgi:hypothetical protein